MKKSGEQEQDGRRNGRPRLEIDMRRAVRLRAEGMSGAAIARALGVSDATLRIRFKEVEGMPLSALSRGSALVNDGDRRDS